jgi:hypothetical protein
VAPFRLFRGKPTSLNRPTLQGGQFQELAA